MFHRVLYEDWQLVFPVVAFAAAIGFFAVMSWRALRMRREQADRFARLPLDDDARRPPVSISHE